MNKYVGELLLFHSTTKENLKGIMKEGIKPGMSGGWCDLEIKRIEKEENEEDRPGLLKAIQNYKEDCKNFIFLSPDFHHIEHEMPKGSDVIIILCLPMKMVLIPSRILLRYVPFEEWIDLIEKGELKEEYLQVIVNSIIPPEYIIGILEVEGEREWGSEIGATTFKINRYYSKFIKDGDEVEDGDEVG